MKAGFLQKLIDRLDRLEPQDVQGYLARLVQEKGVFERVFEALEEGVIVLDASGRITFLNTAACRLLGLQRDQALDASLSDKIQGLNWKNLLGGDRQAVSRDLEITYPEHRYLNFYLAPLADPAPRRPDGAGGTGGTEGGDGPVDRELGYVMLVRDITQHRRLTEEMIESEKMSTLTMLAAGVAHELGNPLNSLTIHLQLLDRKLKKKAPHLHGELGGMVEIAQSEIRRLDFIIKQFLSAIRPTTPQLELLDLNEIVRESVRRHSAELDQHTVAVTLDLSEAIPLLPLDGDQMKQACTNLIKNAYQAMADGGHLTVRSSLEDNWVVLSFGDTGTGIPAETMSTLFQPFATTKASGTGLGLLIVRRIVREHGGQIEIASEEESGTTTTLRLPLAGRGPRLLEDRAATAAVIDI